MRVRVEGAQMPGLGFGNKGFLGAIPEMDIGPVDGFQLMGVNVLVAVPDSFSLSGRPYLLAFIQQDVEIMGVEHPSPESGPMIAGPNIEALVIPERVHAPSGQRKQGRRVQDGVVNDNLIAFQHARQNLATQ